MKNETRKRPAPNDSMLSLPLQLNCNSGDQYSSSSTAAAWENCSQTDVFVRQRPAKLQMYHFQISSICHIHIWFQASSMKCCWCDSDPFCNMMWFVMCLLSWELGADADMQNITCVSLVQHSRCLLLSHNLKKNSTETYKSSKYHKKQTPEHLHLLIFLL